MRPGLTADRLLGLNRARNNHLCSPETSLDNLEALAPSIDKVADRHTNIVVDNFAVTLGSVVVAKDTHGTDDLDTRRVRRDDHNTLLPVLVRILGVALTEHQVESAAWVTGTTDVPVYPVTSVRILAFNVESSTHHL